MRNRQVYEIGQKVRYIGGGKHFRPTGRICEVIPSITMNGAVLVSESYRVLYDGDDQVEAGDESGNLAGYNLEPVE